VQNGSAPLDPSGLRATGSDKSAEGQRSKTHHRHDQT
jgi:hypothetical protein